MNGKFKCKMEAVMYNSAANVTAFSILVIEIICFKFTGKQRSTLF